MQEIINQKNSQILEHKLALESTDYKAIRTAEGYELSIEIKTEREAHRESIRTLEAEVQELEMELQESNENLTFQDEEN